MGNSWLKIITPFIILSILFLLAIVYLIITQGEGPEATGYSIILNALAAVAVMLITDFLLKKKLKVKLGWIWVIEALLMLVLVYGWIVS
jgi:hypothetical protein